MHSIPRVKLTEMATVFFFRKIDIQLIFVQVNETSFSIALCHNFFFDCYKPAYIETVYMKNLCYQ